MRATSAGALFQGFKVEMMDSPRTRAAMRPSACLPGCGPEQPRFSGMGLIWFALSGLRGFMDRFQN